MFTEGSLTQLDSHGFSVLYFPYELVVDAFSSAGVDANFDEDSADSELAEKVAAYEALNSAEREGISEALRRLNQSKMKSFFSALEKSLTRTVATVYVLPLHGCPCEVSSVGEAMEFISEYDESISHSEFIRYEVQVRYANGDEIRGCFEDKGGALAFLRKVQ